MEYSQHTLLSLYEEHRHEMTLLESTTIMLFAADALLFMHVLFVVFVIFGLILIYVGKVRVWSWIRNPWFRLIHIVVVGVVVVQSWLGLICPLTTIEMALRSRAGDEVYSESFISHWLQTILYYDAPPWIFVVCYTVFGALVIASWIWIRPR